MSPTNTHTPTPRLAAPLPTLLAPLPSPPEPAPLSDDSDTLPPALSSSSLSSSLEDDSTTEDISPSSPPFALPSLTPASDPKPHARPSLRSIDSTRSTHSIFSHTSSPELDVDLHADAGYDTECDFHRLPPSSSAARKRSLRRHPNAKLAPATEEEEGEDAGRPGLQRGGVYSPQGQISPVWGKRKTPKVASPLSTPRAGNSPTMGSGHEKVVVVEKAEEAVGLLGLGFQGLELRAESSIVALVPADADLLDHFVDIDLLHSSIFPAPQSPDRPSSCPTTFLVPPSPPTPAPTPKRAPKPSLTPLRRPAHAPARSSPLALHCPTRTPVPPSLRGSPLLAAAQAFQAAHASRPRVPSAPVTKGEAERASLREERMHRHRIFCSEEAVEGEGDKGGGKGGNGGRLRYVVTPPPVEGRLPVQEGTQLGVNPYFMGR